MRRFTLGLVMGAFVLAASACGPKKPAQGGISESPIVSIPQPSELSKPKPPAPPAAPSQSPAAQPSQPSSPSRPTASSETTTTAPAKPAAPQPTKPATAPSPQKTATTSQPQPSSKPTSPQPTPSVQEPQQTFVYRVQLYAFNSYRRANNALLQLKKKFPTYKFFIENEEGYYKVQAGDFPTRADAETAKEFFKKNGYSDAFIVGVMTTTP